MSQSKILVDTNAYLRLAKTIHPLLFVPFGENEYCLYIIPELNNELIHHRLLSKFPWTSEEDYQENRKLLLKLSKKQQKAIANTFDYVWDHAKSETLGTSKVDVKYIAYAIELEIPIVTDDQDMAKLAKEFDVIVMPTLQLLKIMYDAGHTNLQTINGLVEYWRYTSDNPANLNSDYKKYFGS